MFLATGCYLSHVTYGQTQLLLARKPVARVIANPHTPEGVREKLQHVQKVREFARTLGFSVDQQYTSYVAWPHDRIVTLVSATPPYSIDPIQFRFPIVGAVPYKGYFNQARAEKEAARLRTAGDDVCLSPVRAYSTLGWFEDPLTSPMLQHDFVSLTEVILHELMHATVYAKGHADFNEAAATFAGQEATVLFFEAANGADSLEAREARKRNHDLRKIAAIKLEFRQRVTALYTMPFRAGEQMQERRKLEDEARAALRALDLEAFEAARVSENAELNDACLALVGTYHAAIPAYEIDYEALGRDFRAWLAKVKATAKTLK